MRRRSERGTAVRRWSAQLKQLSSHVKLEQEAVVIYQRISYLKPEYLSKRAASGEHSVVTMGLSSFIFEI